MPDTLTHPEQQLLDPKPDHILGYEQQVLGSMLKSTAAVDDVSPILLGSDFRELHHERIYDAIQRQATSGGPTDTLGVAEALADDLAACGGHAYLFELIQSVITASNVVWNADRVREGAIVRKVRTTGQQLQTLADTEMTALEIVNAARADLDAMVEDRTETTNDTAVFDAIDSLSVPLGVPTAWQSLNDGISGWAPGMLYVVGARPGVGKTAVSVCALLDAARRGSTAVMFSMEMPKNELYLRMLSNVGSVDGDSILHRRMNTDEHKRMADAAHDISKLPLVVDDRSNISLAQMRAKIRATQRTRDVGLVVVDYLGLVKPPPDAPKGDRRVQVDAIAQGLKNLARDLKVPVVALSQLNRGIEGRQEKSPTMADLRESGGIESAADYVLLMHRDVKVDPRQLLMFLLKNRHGPQTFFDLDFNGRYSRATDTLWTPTSAYGKDSA